MVVIVLILVTVGYFVLGNKTEQISPQSTPPSTQSKNSTSSDTQVQSSVQKTEWKTYSNSNYNFSIQYPCTGWCKEYPPTPSKNSWTESSITFTTMGNAHVSVGTYTNESVKEWNDNLEGPGRPFPLSLSSVQEALKLPVDSTCKIHSYDSESSYDCMIVLISGEKAVQVINAGSFITFPIRAYVISRGENKWLSITETYSHLPSKFLYDESEVTPEFRKDIDATSEVIKTLRFYPVTK